MAKAYLSLGTNLGDKENNLRQAIEHINKRIGSVFSQSAFYVTEPWGFNSSNTFLNAAIGVETTLSPLELLKEIQTIEKEMGRATKSQNRIYTDRLIDIDILLYGDLVLHTDNLVIPHPLMTERSFVMEPLKEIAGAVLHPVRNKVINEL